MTDLITSWDRTHFYRPKSLLVTLKEWYAKVETAVLMVAVTAEIYYCLVLISDLGMKQ